VKITPVKTPKFIKFLLPKLIWTLPDNEQSVYLTFDDGPTPEITDWTLDQLKAYNAKATFFCIGKNVVLYPEIYNRIIEEGHTVGNHTQNHLNGWKTKTSVYLEEVANAKNFINSRLFRPPYGLIKPQQAKALIKIGYTIIMWNVLSFDWNKSVAKQQCLDNVLKNTSSGDIVVFHDSVKASKNMMFALPKVLEELSEKNFKFKCIPERFQ